jgi:hypothetical protein
MSKVEVVVGESVVQVAQDFAHVAKSFLEWGVDLIDVFSDPESPESFTVVVRSSDCALSIMEGILLGNKVLALDLVGDDDMITTTQIAYDAPTGFGSFTFMDLPMDRKDQIIDAIRVALHVEEFGSNIPDTQDGFSN